ncbi:hypothetical protein EDC04DRAFT_926767 [Pisolithus marmoratus]|nr:hypothetical protein EDC04DRAFT_926767 [Pisolithus marmoratus]
MKFHLLCHCHQMIKCLSTHLHLCIACCHLLQLVSCDMIRHLHQCCLGLARLESCGLGSAFEGSRPRRISGQAVSQARPCRRLGPAQSRGLNKGRH